MNGAKVIDRLIAGMDLIGPFMAVGFLLLILWNAPPRHLRKQYGIKECLLWLIPFSDTWRAQTSLEHQSIVKRYRLVFFVAVSYFSIAALFEMVYYKFLFLVIHPVP